MDSNFRIFQPVSRSLVHCMGIERISCSVCCLSEKVDEEVSTKGQISLDKRGIWNGFLRLVVASDDI